MEHQWHNGLSLPNPIPVSQTCQVDTGFCPQRRPAGPTVARVDTRNSWIGLPCVEKSLDAARKSACATFHAGSKADRLKAVGLDLEAKAKSKSPGRALGG